MRTANLPESISLKANQPNHSRFRTKAYRMLICLVFLLFLGLGNQAAASGDTIPPVVTLVGVQTDSIAVFSKYVDPGVTATDNVDKSSDLKIVVSGTYLMTFDTGIANITGTYILTYTVSDLSGNKTSINRYIKVQDRTAPVITLRGPQSITIPLNYNYAYPTFQVSDNYDKPGQTLIDSEGTFYQYQSSRLGLYNYRYWAIDRAGNKSYSDYRYILVSATFFDTVICKDGCAIFTSPIKGDAYTWTWNGGKTKDSSSVNDYVKYCASKTDTIDLKVYKSGKVASEYQFWAIVTDYSCVWPGDANNDGVADKNDVLNIGVAYGNTEYSRGYHDTMWIQKESDDWSKSFKSGTNYKFADCDGGGNIDSFDMKVVGINYGKTHMKTSAPNGSPTDPPLYVSFANDSVMAGDTLKASIQLGSSSNPIKNVYGLAFSISYTGKYVQTNKISTDFSKCWLGTPGKDLMYLVHNDSANGILDIAICRIDHKNMSGSGTLANLGIVMQDNVGGKRWVNKNIYFNPMDVKIISADETPLSVYTQIDSTVVYQHSSGIKPAAAGKENIRLFPNPASQILNIISEGEQVSQVRIMNLLGAELIRQKTDGTSIQIPVSQLNAGIYYLEIQTRNGITVKEFVKN